MLYYLEKFCRICIQTGGKLTDIEEKDEDAVSFSEKLKACTQMVITRESLSTQICSSCVHKLRISYQFQSMCRKSTTILQQYLTELLSSSDEITAEKLLKSEITISTVSLPKPRRKRVGKDERCSLLRKLLSKITQDEIVHNIHTNGLAKLCDKIPQVIGEKQLSPVAVWPKIESPAIKSEVQTIDNLEASSSSGNSLRQLLNFTKNFNFDYDASHVVKNCNNLDLTPLERLTHFTHNFFYDHFADYRETILQVCNNAEFDSSDDEQMFEESATPIKEEILIIEPDLDLKREMFYDENEEANMSDYDIVQTCYDSSDNVKSEENTLLVCKSNVRQQCNNSDGFVRQEREDDFRINFANGSGCSVSDKESSHHSYSSELDLTLTASDFLLQTSLESNLLNLYDAKVHFRKERTMSPYSLKCRTRGNPFINPQLKKQFQMRNFKCRTCNRRFKSPGYLKAHCTKLRHQCSL